MNFEQIKNIVHPKNVIDIGANDGWFTNNLLNHIPNCRVIMIEANENFKQVLSNIRQQVFLCALSNETTTKQFYINKNNKYCTGASFYKENSSSYDDADIVELKTTTLDNLSLFRAEQIDLIKMDVQGSELDIINGANKTLERTKYLLLELSLSDYNIGAPNYEDVIKVLNSKEFYCIELIGNNKINQNDKDIIHQVDILFGHNPEKNQSIINILKDLCYQLNENDK